MSARHEGPMRETATDYEVVAVNPETGENVWVSIGSPEAAAWPAGVLPNGEHGRFVEKPKAQMLHAVDWDQKPILVWAGMQPLEETVLVRKGDRRPSRNPQRRWRLEDRKTGSVTRAYTMDELLVRLQARSWATLGRKTVVDDQTGGKWRARDAAQCGAEWLLEGVDRLQSASRRREIAEMER